MSVGPKTGRRAFDRAACDLCGGAEPWPARCVECPEEFHALCADCLLACWDDARTRDTRARDMARVRCPDRLPDADRVVAALGRGRGARSAMIVEYCVAWAAGTEPVFGVEYPWPRQGTP
ncbi:MAG: hypothetical protein ACE5Q3_11935 [Alphaproteobacteria bacterium]